MVRNRRITRRFIFDEHDVPRTLRVLTGHSVVVITSLW
jgi:hypothetical protein